MAHTTQDNAMTEIALALAMAFFSILVLALVSMGGSHVPSPKVEINLEKGTVLSKSNPTKEERATSTAPMKTQPEQLLIFFEGRYFDSQLKETDPAQYGQKKKVILAVAPSLSMTEALSAEKAVPNNRKIVTTLNKEWITALKEKTK